MRGEVRGIGGTVALWGGEGSKSREVIRKGGMYGGGEEVRGLGVRGVGSREKGVRGGGGSEGGEEIKGEGSNWGGRGGKERGYSVKIDKITKSPNYDFLLY